MRFTQNALSLLGLIITPICTSALVQNTAFVRPIETSSLSSIVNSVNFPKHHSFCQCDACMNINKVSKLFMSEVEDSEKPPVVEDEVPSEVVAMDGVETGEEAHNIERPARASGTAKHKPRENSGKPLAELEIGSTVEGTVKSITAYGAFVNIGAVTDALLHVSRLSDDFVANVEDVIKVGQTVQVRILNTDSEKNQIGVSMRSEEADARGGGGGGEGTAGKSRPRRSGGDRAAQQEIIKSLTTNGYDATKFIEGEVQRTLDFGAFVRFAISDIGDGLTGEIDGLVHISAMSTTRVNKVSDVCKPGDKIQIRVKNVDAESGKIALTMVSVEDEKKGGKKPKRRAKGQFSPEEMGAKDWKEQLEKFQVDMPVYSNRGMVIDKR